MIWTTVVVIELTTWQSVESLADKVPALFFGKSNHLTGILNIL